MLFVRVIEKFLNKIIKNPLSQLAKYSTYTADIAYLVEFPKFITLTRIFLHYLCVVFELIKILEGDSSKTYF